MEKRILAVLLMAALCLGMLAGCGNDSTGQSKDNNDTTNEVWKSGGVAYLTEDGEVKLLKDLDGEGGAISLSENGGTFNSGSRYFTNVPADGDTMPSAVFSKDGTKLYYFTDIDGKYGVLRCADVSKLKAEGDKNGDYLEKLTTDVFAKLFVQANGTIYTARKGNSERVYFHDGNQISELLSDSVEKSWLTNDGKGFVYWTSEGEVEYVSLDKDAKHSTLVTEATSVLYDGGSVLYCRVSNPDAESSVGVAGKADSDRTPERDYDYDRKATDKSSAGYDNHDERIYRVTLDGKSEVVLEELYSLVGVANGNLYYTLRYIDKIRLSNLVDDAENLDRDLLYDLDHNYIEDIRYELWCHNGKDSVLICEDYYGRYYEDGDYYEEPEEYIEELLSEGDYLLSAEFIERSWDKLDDIDDLCEDYDISSIDALSKQLHEAAYGENGDYELLEEYFEIVEDSDVFEILENLCLGPYFYADGQIVLYTRAVKNEVSSIEAAPASYVEQAYWRQRCGGNPFTCNAYYTLSSGESGVIEGVNADDFYGVFGDKEALVFYDTRHDTLRIYAADTNENLLTVKNAEHITIAGNVLYYYEDSDLVRYNGKETAILAEDVYVADCAAWVYADGITLALSDMNDGEGTLRTYKDGDDEWVADDVSYYQRITDKEIIYISDGTLYIYTIGKDAVRLADDVAEIYGAYYGGVLVGYDYK